MRSSWVVFLLLAGACGRSGYDGIEAAAGEPPAPGDDPPAAAPASSWWDAAWTRRTLFTYENPSGEMLYDLPAVLYFEPTNHDAALTADDLADVRIVDEDGVTVLAHDVERYDSSGVGWAWVTLPRVSPGSHQLWLYHGNPGATATAAAWPADYLAVWHLEDERDATGRGNDLGTMNAPSKEGAVGTGRELDPSGPDYLMVADSASLRSATTSLTVSAWAWPDSDHSQWRSIVARQNIDVENDFYLGTREGRWVAGLTTSAGSSYRTSAVEAALHTWHWVVFSWDGSRMRLFLDGEELALGDAGLGGQLANRANPVLVGADCDFCTTTPETDYWDGLIDKVRIDRSVPSPAWIAAEYAAQSFGFFSFEAVEERP